MWERFSYYGMRGFLILYMVKALGFTDVHAGSVYGNYVGSVWLAAIFGGVIADRWLGHYRSVLIGGAIIALGHFTLAFHALSFFYAGLTLIVVGTGWRPWSCSSRSPRSSGAHTSRPDPRSICSRIATSTSSSWGSGCTPPGSCPSRRRS